jgi:hypothetical protein
MSDLILFRPDETKGFIESSSFSSRSSEIDIVKRRLTAHYPIPTQPRVASISFPAQYLSPSDQIFEREKNSFAKLKETLLRDPNYLNRYVAIVDGKVVDSDYDDSILTERLYKKFGYIPLFIGKITPKRRVVELPSPERV